MFMFVLSSFHELFREAPEEEPSMQTPTPFHDPTPKPGSLVFLDPPRAQAKRNVAYSNGSSGILLGYMGR